MSPSKSSIMRAYQKQITESRCCVEVVEGAPLGAESEHRLSGICYPTSPRQHEKHRVAILPVRAQSYLVNHKIANIHAPISPRLAYNLHSIESKTSSLSTIRTCKHDLGVRISSWHQKHQPLRQAGVEGEQTGRINTSSTSGSEEGWYSHHSCLRGTDRSSN
jgi:hypothetical protein